MKYITLVLLGVAFLINIFRNKKMLFTMGCMGGIALITYFTNIKFLSYSEAVLGINEAAFIFISVVLMLLTIIIAIIYRFNQRKISFILIFVVAAVLIWGLINDPNTINMLYGEKYFKYNFNLYINNLMLLCIQANLVINYISQGELFK